MKVSIIITCYNREHFIGRAIRSAISQNFPKNDFEIIVVDDGSKDHSREVISDFKEAVIPIFHPRNKGLPSARNSGIRQARGRFVVHVDSDDYMHQDMTYIETFHLEENPEWGAVSCDYYLVDRLERHLEKVDGYKKPIACGIMFRKENLIDIGLYDPRMRFCEDEELRLRYKQRYFIGHVNLPLYRYTKHETNMTNNDGEVQKYRKKIRLKNAS